MHNVTSLRGESGTQKRWLFSQRQVSARSIGLRIGMLGPVLAAVHGALGTPGEAPGATERAVASLACGALGGACVNPVEVMKVRMQVQGGATGHQHPYEGVAAGLRALVRDEGLRGCVRGIGTSTLRGVVGPGSQLFACSQLLEPTDSARSRVRKTQ